MTIDYQVLEFRSTTPVREVGFFSTSPLTLDVKGFNFRNVAEVRVNGVRSPEFIVVSPTRVLAEVPRSQRSASIDSVVVVVADDVNAPKAIVSFLAVVPRGQTAFGSTRMVQSFLKLLFTTPGRDIFLPGLGGGLLALVGSTNTPANLKAAAKIAISTTQVQLVRVQAQDKRLATNERLKSATLLSAEFDPKNGTLAIRIRLKSVSGSTVDSGVIV